MSKQMGQDDLFNSSDTFSPFQMGQNDLFNSSDTLLPRGVIPGATRPVRCAFAADPVRCNLSDPNLLPIFPPSSSDPMIPASPRFRSPEFRWCHRILKVLQ